MRGPRASQVTAFHQTNPVDRQDDVSEALQSHTPSLRELVAEFFADQQPDKVHVTAGRSLVGW